MKRRLLFIFHLLLAFSINNYGQADINISNLLSFDGEPSIAINPANSNNIIAGWMRLRLDGKIWIATTASFDGGLSWSAINFLPHDTVVNGSADVSIVFHNSGVAYLSYINLRLSPDTAGAVFLTKSTDGGLTWNAPNKIIDFTDKPDLPIDRPWISVDNSGGVNDGTVYFTSMSIYFYTGQHHIYLRSTTNGGNTWSAIKQVDDSLFSPGVMTVSYAPISVGADGKVYITYMSYDTSISPFVRQYIATTTDKGNTFQRYIAGNVFPAYSKLPAYTVSADPVNNGSVILNWCDTRYGDLDVLLSKSTDGGQTWSTPVRINDDAVSNGIIQDQVWSAFSATGKLAVAWRDRRMNDTTSASPFDIYASVSLDGGNSFQPNYRLSSASSPYQFLSCCNSFIGLALTDSFVVANWGDNRNADWEIYFNRTTITATEIKENSFDSNFNLQVFPNPANSETIIQFTLPRSQFIELKIMNVSGEEIKSLIKKDLIKGNHSATLDTKHFSAGIYYVILMQERNVMATKTIVIK
ncbi:MAG: T9SS type A sorting domain-containing protein [Bacteroidetes bacterium]|nr:MAG: T9SS type A sorting domain-containing protein [Bacteroidota bacterium]